MPRASRLKVYRLPIGFHDAYVAAPSQKAAIAAWGSDTDVFARKQAELVTDAALTKEPLARPGTVVKRLRATAAEQIAALGETPAPPARRRKPGPSSDARSGPRPAPGNDNDRPGRKAKPKPPPKPKPRPGREKLDETEQALAEVEARHKAALNELREREVALARERKALEKKQDEERERLEARRDKAEAAYDEAMRRWRES